MTARAYTVVGNIISSSGYLWGDVIYWEDVDFIVEEARAYIPYQVKREYVTRKILPAAPFWKILAQRPATKYLADR